MKTVVIANPAAGGGKLGRSWPHLQAAIVKGLGPVEARLTTGIGDAVGLTRRALADGAERIVVVGGDGTLNEVVNGFFTPEGAPLGRDVVLAVVPAGTGGDFGRSIGVEGISIEQDLALATVRPMDVGRVEVTGSTGPVVRYFANIASFGSSGLVVDKVNRSSKRLGAKASYLISAVSAMLEYRNCRVRLTLDGKPMEARVNIVAVANARYFGGAMKVAPGAYLDDGIFDVVVVGDIGLPTFLAVSRKLYHGRHTEHPKVSVYQAREVVVELLDGAAMVETDGESPGAIPARFTILPRAIKVLAPWSRAEAALPAS
jgi:diacylglycerol kinase (ATP)